MKIEVSWFPPGKVMTEPKAEATYPFEIYGDFRHIVEFPYYAESGLTNHYEVFFCSWMENPDYYPVYSLVEIFDFQQAEFEDLYREQDIAFNCVKGEYKDTFFVKAVIRTPQQFKAYYPYLYGNGSMLNLSLWSIKHDVFSLEEREHESPYPVKRTKNNITRLIKLTWSANVPIVTLTGDSTVFWVGHDGNYITVISNNEHFSGIDSLQKMVPEMAELVENYEWE
ncbi:hypothetical protein SFC50_02165 [Bacillus infantis]|uniref:hypothetical protein n=1 Tax=Bacillus infantis TaxID=324767 RepID=UPI0039825A84